MQTQPRGAPRARAPAGAGRWGQAWGPGAGAAPTSSPPEPLRPQLPGAPGPSGRGSRGWALTHPQHGPSLPPHQPVLPADGGQEGTEPPSSGPDLLPPGGQRPWDLGSAPCASVPAPPVNWGTLASERLLSEQVPRRALGTPSPWTGPSSGRQFVGVRPDDSWWLARLTHPHHSTPGALPALCWPGLPLAGRAGRAHPGTPPRTSVLRRGAPGPALLTWRCFGEKAGEGFRGGDPK